MAVTHTSPIFYGRPYPEGPRVSPPIPLFPGVVGGAVQPVSNYQSFDFSNSGMSCLQSVEIDNTQNPNMLIMTVSDSQQVIFIEPFTIKTAPLYTGVLMFTAQFSCPYVGVAPVATIKFFNVPQDFATRTQFVNPPATILTSNGYAFQVQGDTQANVSFPMAMLATTIPANTEWALITLIPIGYTCVVTNLWVYVIGTTSSHSGDATQIALSVGRQASQISNSALNGGSATNLTILRTYNWNSTTTAPGYSTNFENSSGLYLLGTALPTGSTALMFTVTNSFIFNTIISSGNWFANISYSLIPTVNLV